MEREVDHGEARVIGQREHEWRLQGSRQDLNLDAGLAGDRHRSAQKAQDPRFDVAHVVHHDRTARSVACVTRQKTPNSVPIHFA